MKKEIMPVRSYRLELAALIGAVSALSFFTAACTTAPVDETSCSYYQAQLAAGAVAPTDVRTEIEYAPFPALWGNVFPLEGSGGQYIGMFAPQAFEYEGHRGTVLVTGVDQCEWFDAIN